MGIMDRINRAQEAMSRIDARAPAEDQLRELKKVLAFTLQELGDLAVKVDALTKR